MCAVLLIAGVAPARAEPGPSLDDALSRLVTGLRSGAADQHRLDVGRAESVLRRARADQLRGQAGPEEVAAALAGVRDAREARRAFVTPLFAALTEALGLKRFPEREAIRERFERVTVKQATLIRLLERYMRIEPRADAMRGSLEMMRGILAGPGYDPFAAGQFLADYETYLDDWRARLADDVDALWGRLLGRTEAAARAGPGWAAGRLAEVAAAARAGEDGRATWDEVLAARMEAIETLRTFEGTTDFALDQARRRAPVRRKEFQRGMVTLRRAADVLADRDPARAASLRERLAAYGAEGAAGIQASGELSDSFRDDVDWAAADLRRGERPPGDDPDAAGAVPFQPGPGGNDGGSGDLRPGPRAPVGTPPAILPPRRETGPGGRAQAAPAGTALAPAPLAVTWEPAAVEVPGPGPVLTGFGAGLETMAWP